MDGVSLEWQRRPGISRLPASRVRDTKYKQQPPRAVSDRTLAYVDERSRTVGDARGKTTKPVMECARPASSVAGESRRRAVERAEASQRGRRALVLVSPGTSPATGPSARRRHSRGGDLTGLEYGGRSALGRDVAALLQRGLLEQGFPALRIARDDLSPGLLGLTEDDPFRTD